MVYIKYNQEEGELSFMSDKIIENNQVEIMEKLHHHLRSATRCLGKAFIW